MNILVLVTRQSKMTLFPTFLPHSHCKQEGLKYDTCAFFTKGIGLLRRKTNQQTIFLLVLGDVLHDVLDSFAHRDSL